MPTIDQSKLPPEITSKYSIVNNAFRLDKIINAAKDVYKNEPKDEINVEIGDSKQTEFYPQIKLCRWTNETNFSVRLKDTEYEKATITTDKDKIIWDKDNIKIEFFDYAENSGGHKMVWYLKSKPLTNKVEFSLQSKGLNFFYQPPLTQEYQNGYSEEFKREIEVSETQVWGKLTQEELDKMPDKPVDGMILLVERPENVVGSYAVYHQTKGGMNDINGKEYKTGQMGMIYPSHLTDAVGNKAKAILTIDIVNGTFTEEIPQEFLDKAVYPIKGNTDFGYMTLGGTATAITGDLIRASNYNNTTTNAGTAISVSFGGYVEIAEDTADWQGGLYDISSNLLSPQTATGTINSDTKQFWTLDFTDGPTLVIATKYIIAAFLGYDGFLGTIWFAYNSGGTSGDSKYKTALTYNSWPNPITFSNSSNRYSIYATYTPAGGGAGPANLKTYNTNATANIKSIDTNLIANVKTLNTNA